MATVISDSSKLTRDGMTAQELYDKCMSMASNLWWVWSSDAVELFRDIDPVLWRQCDHNPVKLLADYTPEQLDRRASENALYCRINQCYRLLKEYLANTRTWGMTNAGVLGARPVAYFSAEFGIHESMPIYSGGLGVLSGDHIKSASDLGVPMVGVGLFYGQGYFRQYLDENGYQHETYVDTNTHDIAMRPALDTEGLPVRIAIETRSGNIGAKVWQLDVGRVRLFLLDCNVEGNSEDDRRLTSRLYGGDERTRIRQELVLGVGGVRALVSLGITPGVYHLNEGHSAFGPLEVMRQKMADDGCSFENAVREVTQQTAFTTHTPVPAGHDRFGCDLVEEHLGPLRDELGITYDQLMSLGRVDPQNTSESFCMTVIGLKLSRKANAVSQLHGHVSRRMWASLWPWRVEEEIPIGHITNGVHIPSWLSVQIKNLYDKFFQQDWTTRMGEPEVWQGIYDVDPGELWETHNVLKNQLIQFVRRRVSASCRRREEGDAAIERARHILDPAVLTVGFARRFATYKRARLLFQDLERIAAIANDSQRPVQFVFAGKAHPKDEPGKQFIQSVANLRHDPRFRETVVFLEDYDINVCRHLIRGVDVWLNNPRRPLEASGTSGQKVVYNGGLNFSVLDGWWSEAYNGVNGFAIGKGTQHVDDAITDQRDAASLYETLENKIIPTFYFRDRDGLPREWIHMMMNSISTLAWRFSSHRMVMDYTRNCYVPAAGGLSCQM
ncbi:MAG: alpha-glucan family phosphorylase [Planctomycetota bacterium]|nr:alpha-glucan family phosphorylase [Planctomycetota bacterium]